MADEEARASSTELADISATMPLSANPVSEKKPAVFEAPEMRISRTLSTVDYSSLKATAPEEMEKDQLIAEVKRLRYEVIDVETRNNARRAFELFEADGSGDIDSAELREALVRTRTLSSS